MSKQATAVKNKSMALDFVEAGDEDSLHQGLSQRTKDVRDLPEGITSRMLYGDIVQIAWPSMIEMFLTQLSSMVGLMMVGQLGPWALNSVGLSTQPKFLMMMAFMSLNVGATAMVARYKGAGQQEKANQILRQALLMTFCFSIIGSILGFVFSEPLIRFMGAPDAQSLAGGTIYLRIQFVGFIGFALTSTATAALRGVGNSRIAMTYNIISNVVNVIFNFLLITGRFGFPELGVAGSSLATVMGQFVAFGLAMRSLFSGKNYLHLRLRDGFKPDKEAMADIIKIGLPSLAEQMVMRVGMITYTKTVTSLGTLSYATHMACMNVQQMSFMLGQALAVSATSLVGQSLGKMRSDMAQFYASRTRRIGMCVSLALGLVFVFFGRQIISLYAGDNPDSQAIIDFGGQIMRLVAVILPFQSSQFILAGALRGAGDTRSTAMISFITVLLVRPGFALLAVNVFHWGLWGAWIALFLDQILRSLLVLLRYNSGKWKQSVKMRVKKQPA